MTPTQQRLRFLLSGLLILMLAASCAPPATTPLVEKAATASQKPGTLLEKSPAGDPSPTAIASSEQSKYGGILATVCRATVPHFDVHQLQTIGGQAPFASAYNQLVELDPLDETKLVGDLASKWELSSDALVYTFRLNEGVKFHNGRPMTSEDVKFNMDRIIFPPKGVVSVREEMYRAVEKIETPDQLTVKITLKRSQPSFLRLLALPFNFTFAPEVIKQKGDMKRDVMGTGPFKLQNYAEGVSLRMQRNPDYFVKGRPYLDGVMTYIIVDEMARIAAFRTKQVVLLPLNAEVTAVRAAELQKAEPGITVQKKPEPSMTALTPNVQVKPWNDIRVREAVNLLIDREAASKVVRAGGYYPGYGFVQPGSPWALGEQELMSMPGVRRPKDQDVAEAKSRLSEAGYPAGFKTTLIASSSIHVKEAAEFTRTELAKIGIDAEVRIMETSVFRDRLVGGGFDAAVVGDTFADPDPDLVLGEGYLTGSPRNYGKWSNAKYDELYTAQSSASDTAKRKEIAAVMQKLLHKESPRVVITWSGRFALWWPQLKDWRPGTTVYHSNKFQDVWLAR
ncbi:MAG: ABC transporter substrate-binding protein [Chloroflexi bacterium]|nr:ABC transporter substrate-binding protein [Chloroflexota bacterium]